jgi:hypothetical protein
MKFPWALIAALVLFSAQATLSASASYGFGTIPAGSPEDSVGISLGLEGYTAGSWTETNWNDVTTTANNGNTDENIDCVVALASATHVCGNSGPNGAADIPITAPTGTPGGGVTNYLMIDGDPQWGAPVSVDMTGLTKNETYTISFYQAASEETSATPNSAYDDSWQAYLLPTSDSAGVFICTQAYCADNGVNGGTVAPAPSGSTLVFNGNTNTLLMEDAAGSSTAWESESFTFVAGAASQVLEFVTNVAAAGTDDVLAAGTTFEPPMLAIADITITSSVPEPGTWTLTILGAGMVIAAGRLRRKFSARRSSAPRLLGR